MTRPRRRAAVLAAALQSWSITTADQAERTARLVTRAGPDWRDERAVANLTDLQVTRLLALLREDLIPDQPATPAQVTATLDQLLAEWRAEGRTRIGPADFHEALPRLGCTTEALAEQIVRLVDQRYLRETRRPGTYLLHHS